MPDEKVHVSRFPGDIPPEMVVLREHDRMLLTDKVKASTVSAVHKTYQEWVDSSCLQAEVNLQMCLLLVQWYRDPEKNKDGGMTRESVLEQMEYYLKDAREAHMHALRTSGRLTPEQAASYPMFPFQLSHKDHHKENDNVNREERQGD